MQTKISTKSRTLVFLLSFAMVMTFLVTMGQKDDWRAYAADSGNAQYSLEGAVYWVYTDSACTTRAKDTNGNNIVLTVGSNGITNEVNVESGRYYAKEKTPPKGYILDETVYTANVAAGETFQVEASDIPQSGNIKIKKKTNIGDKPLVGAVFEIKYTDGESITRTWRVKSGSNGEATLDNFVSGDERYRNSQGQYVIPLGTVTVKEIEAPAGFVKDDKTYTVQIKHNPNGGESDPTITVSGDGKLEFVNKVQNNPNINLQKVDKDTGSATPGYGATFAGAEFEIKYTGDYGNKTWKAVTNANGAWNLSNITGDAPFKNSQGQNCIPIGKITVRETKAPKGYALSDEVFTIEVKPDSSGNETTLNVTGSGSKGGRFDPQGMKVSYPDKIQSAPFELQKIDAETGKPVPMGGAKFIGAEFELKCTAGDLQGKTFKLVTDAQGKVTLDQATPAADMYKNSAGKAALKIGTYELTEKKAPEGYLLNKGKYTIKVEGDLSGNETTSAVTGTDGLGYKATLKANPAHLDFPDQVIRGDIKWTKLAARINTTLDVPFIIKSASTGEVHVAFAGENGEFESSSDYNLHTNNTNANDVILDSSGNPIYDSNGWVDVDSLSSTAGIWFEKDKEGNKTKIVDDDLGALPYDTYYVTELRCEANNAYDLVENVPFKVMRDGRLIERDIDNELEEPKYEMYKVRNEAASSNGAGKYGFEPGDYVTYDVVIKNNSIATYTMDVTDEFTEGPENFSKPVVLEVKNAKQNKISKDKTTVNITIEPRQTATVVFGSLVKIGATEYLAAAPEDSDSKDENGNDCHESMQTNIPDNMDGYENVASVKNVKWKTPDGRSEDGSGKEDPAQTPVKTPKIGTFLADDAGRKVVSGKETKLIDHVNYEGLTPGKTYVIEGKLMVKDTKDPLVENGKPVTAKSEPFVPEEANGEVTVTFVVNTTGLAGKEIVAFETAYVVKDEEGNKPKDEDGNETEKTEVAKHEDINDPEQTVEVPGYKMYKVRTTDAPKVDGGYGFKAGDAVDYDVVIENISKSVPLTMDVTDEFVEGAEYFTQPTVKSVTNATENSRTDDETSVNITVEAGQKATVTFETTLKQGAIEYLAKAAKDSDSKDKDGNDVNKKEQANKTDDKDGYKNVAKTTNVEYPTPPDPENPDDPTPPGKLPPDEDEGQTPVKEPEIGTFLSDEAGKSAIGAGVKTKLVDRVMYKGLTPGHRYAVVGELIVKDTQDPLVENGEKVKAVGVLIPEESDGETTVTFEVDTANYIGKELVAFEACYSIEDTDIPDDPTPEEVEEGGTPVAEHKDPKDPDQTVKITTPKIGTYLSDDAKKKSIGPSKKTKLVDVVKYEGLIPGQKYAVVGELIVKDTQDPLVENGKKVKAVGVFTPKKAKGETTVTFEVDTTNFLGKELVAFEVCYGINGIDLPKDPTPEEVEKKGKKIAEHKDPSDPDQTIKIKEPKIGTFLADDAEKKEIDASGSTKLIDTVAYKDLAPGHEYVVVGELIVKDTGNPLVESGNKVKATAKFIPEKDSGVAEVTFVVDTRGLEGKQLVAFETCYSVDGMDLPDNPSPDQVENGGKKVAEHKDLNDENQIVWVKKPGENPPVELPKSPHTGDKLALGAIAGFLFAALGIIVMLIRRKKASVCSK